MVLENFEKIKRKDPEFFYSFVIEEDGKFLKVKRRLQKVRRGCNV